MLTPSDLKQISALLNLKLEDKLEAKLSEKLSHLPSKDDFYNQMDEIMGELKTIRQEHTFTQHRLSKHEDRLSTIEHSLPAEQ